jgi:hypothetical protein
MTPIMPSVSPVRAHGSLVFVIGMRRIGQMLPRRIPRKVTADH